MPNFEGISKEQDKALREDTLEAIEAGTALPLPEFLQEDPEARRAFAEAIKSSEELKVSMSELSDEEREMFLKVFAEVLGSDQQTTKLEEILDSLKPMLTIGSTLAASGVITNNEAMMGTGILVAAAGVIMNFRKMREKSGERPEDLRRIKNFILETAQI